EQEGEVDHIAGGHGKRLRAPQPQEGKVVKERSVCPGGRQVDVRVRPLCFKIPGAIRFRQNVGVLFDRGAHAPDSTSGDGTAVEDGSSAVDGSPRSTNWRNRRSVSRRGSMMRREQVVQRKPIS